MSKIRLFTIFLLLLLPAIILAQKRFRIAEYNVENLFDTIHSEGFNDTEFTPSGSYRWTSESYWRKLGLLARTIAALGDPQPVDIIVLCEVENDSVMRDLTQRTLLRRLNYEYIISHSEDERGINVAMLHSPQTFRPLHHDTLRVSPPPGFRHTRDILHVCGLAISGDTLDIFAVHLPSRSGGRRQTSPWREKVADSLRRMSDSIMAVRQHPNIIMLGDFNDEAGDRSIKVSLGALYNNKECRPGQKDLIVLDEKAVIPDIRGTYRFRHRWYELDHIIVSGNLLLKTTGLRLADRCAHIFSSPHLTEAEGRRALKVKRTFLGSNFHGGVSDHLPLYIDLEY